MDLTEQERQLVECIRRLKDPEQLSIIIRREDGAWELSMSAAANGNLAKSHGVGATFGAAWDNITGVSF